MSLPPGPYNIPDEQKASADAELLIRAEKLRATIVDMYCNDCRYCEATGDLLDHCDRCCRKITAATWKALYK